jgi:hypothetical protein
VIVGNAIYVAGRRTEEFESLQEAYEAVRQRRGVAWIVLYKPTEEEFDSVAREFGLHPLPAEDPVKAPLRTRLERYGSTLFLVLKAARYLDETETVEFGEVDVSVGEGFVVTVLRGEPAALAVARELPEGQLELPGQGAAAILCAIVGRVVDGYDPVVAGLENDIDEIETEVFSGNAGVSRRIYELSREVIEFQKATGPLPDIIDRLTSSVEGPGLPVCDGAHADGLSNAVRGIQAPRVALGGVPPLLYQRSIYMRLDNPLPLCNPSAHLQVRWARAFERSLENGAEEGLGLDAQDLAPARSSYPSASIHGGRTLRPTTN